MKKVIAIVAVALFFGILYGYAHESLYFSNTFGIRYLFFRGLAVGAMLGLGCFFYYKKITTDTLERFQLGAFCVLIGMFVFPYLAISTNHFFAEKGPLSIKVLFQREEPIRTGRFGISKGQLPEIDGFYTYFLRNSDIDRVRSKQQLFRGIESGGEVELPIRKGLWGFEFVEMEQ
jgi:hypothetical protein